MERPLFIPLRRAWFDAFASGAKREEWRRHGPGWNANTCRVGRPVVLALGYSRTRLTGVVTGFRVAPAAGDAIAIYGDGTVCAVITVALRHR
jgi:hypothetical protein